MRIVIIEDEELSANIILHAIKKYRPKDKVVAILSSIKKTISWFKKNSCDLVFMDVELSDGLCFKIFESVELDCPVIFTTAYNQYAISAFKINGIAYILKPVKDEDILEGFAKLESLKSQYFKMGLKDYKSINWFNTSTEYRTKFLVSKGDKLIALKTSDVAYFHAIDRFAFAVTHDGNEFLVNDTLEDLEISLDPMIFFRLNRQILSSFGAIKEVRRHFKTRYKVILTPPYKSGDVVVSTNKSQAFWKWANR